METSQQIFALFVGINEYQFYRQHKGDKNLYGCVNDVELISNTLKKRYGIQDKHCQILLNEKATKKSIIAGFQKHLAQAKKGDTAIFYYSGHGSTEIADPRIYISESDCRNETLVCHDSRADELYDLADKELRYLIHQLSSKGIKVVTIIDSCHAGDATRYLEDDEEDGPTERQTPGSNKTRPLDSYIFFNDPVAQQSWLHDFSKMPEGKHIAISACRNDQLSKEKHIGGPKKYGVFTHSFCQALQYQHIAPSYRNLSDMAGQRVAMLVQNQTPHVESIGVKQDIDKGFLSEKLQPVRYPVLFAKGTWWLNAGLAQGINPKARLALIGPEGNKVAEVEVIDSTPGTAAEGHGSRLSLIGQAALNTHLSYQAEMIDPAITPLPVKFLGAQAHVAALHQELKASPAQYYLQPAEIAPYELNAQADNIVFSRGKGLPLEVDPIISIPGNPSREWVALQLARHMAQWEHTRQLAFAVREDTLPDNLVELVIQQYEPASQQFVKREPENNVFNIYYQQEPDTGELSKPKIKLSVELNTAAPWRKDEDVFISLLFMDPIKGSTYERANKAVLRAEERRDKDGRSKVIKARNPVWRDFTIKKSDGTRKDFITLSVPESLITETGGQTADYLKLIVSNFEIDISTLKQDSLEDLLERLNPEKVRGGKSIDDDEEETDSAEFVRKAQTYTYTLNIIKPPHAIALSNSNAITLLQKSDGNSATPLKQIQFLPHGLDADVSLEYAGDNPENFTALRIELPDDSQQRAFSEEDIISPDNPLELEIDASVLPPEEKGLLVFAREGGEDGFEIPLGYTRINQNNGNTLVTINQLPRSEESSDRSLGGSLLLFFKKITYDKLKLNRDTVQLAIPEFESTHSVQVSGYNKDIESIKKQVAQADKILLFIHGIIGDTQQMAGVVNRVVDGKLLGEGCLALTFDYENLNTPIQETADALRKKLAAVGLDQGHDKELVIIAHSLGGLVARWLLEKDPARPKVDKLVMLGTPNGGSPLQDMKQWLLIMLTLATNGIAGVAGGLGVAGLMYLLKNADDTLDEMSSDSKTLQYLYEAPDPKVPYYMIAGNTQGLQMQLDEEGSRLNRLLAAMKQYGWLKVTKMMTAGLFREANDVAVGLSSMLKIPAGRECEMEVIEVGCDHLSYFGDERTLKYLV